ncbi:hypothetical protein [Brevundimonas sp.]|uniref:hypothetical protein n=1 Tax=Brevundimonas sp. TaxID=1871086 RepID=UPI0028AA676C|nr:hypothetical protein [Brevundimonas sp.]
MIHGAHLDRQRLFGGSTPEEAGDPSADQLKGFFHPDAVPAGLTVRIDTPKLGLNRRKGREP